MNSLSAATFADQPWTLLTYAFLHSDVWHLAVNLALMALLWVDPPQKALTLIAAGILGGGLAYLALGSSAVVGASGAVFALYAAAMWHRRFVAYTAPFVIAAHFFVPWAWPVHLGGFIAGVLISMKWKT